MKEPISFLHLYVNPAWRRTGVFSPLMFPFWGNPIDDAHPFAKELFNTFSFDTSCYTVTDDITQADMVFSPYRQDWYRRQYPELLEECKNTAKRADLPLLIDGVADGEKPLAGENIYVMRIGGYRFLDEKFASLKLPEHLRWESHDFRIEVPTQADDLLMRCREGKFVPRLKTTGKPIVGFAGMANVSPREWIHNIRMDLPIIWQGIFNKSFRAMFHGIFWRYWAVSVVKRSKKISPNLIARNFYSGSTKSIKGEVTEVRQQFVQNILDSDYSLDVRGFANASVRLYEILSLGRIPVILDTERIFPFSDELDWSQFSLIVNYRDMRRLPQIIADFHASISPQEFEAMQRRAREAYVNYFRVDAQMSHIIKELNAKLSATS